MRNLLFLLVAAISLTSCTGPSKMYYSIPETNDRPYGDTLITQSLFTEKNSNISEENIQKILNGGIVLPEKLRVAVIRLDQNERRYSWNDEEYQKMNQEYMDMLTDQLKRSARIFKVSSIPDLLISKPLNFTSIREAAVRMQADIAVVYSITGDTYSKYKLFSKPDFKSFANTQLIVLDIRTGLVPFSTVITKDVIGQKKENELDLAEARKRIQHEATLQTLSDIGQRLYDYLNQK